MQNGIAVQPIRLLPIDSIITFSFQPGVDLNNLAADNTTLLNVQVNVANTDFAGESIRLQTIGEWSFFDRPTNPVDLPIDISGNVNCQLKLGDDPLPVSLRAIYKSYTVNSPAISLKPALPDTLLLVARDSSIIQQTNGRLTLSLFANRDSGSVSNGIDVFFEAEQNGVMLNNFNPPFIETVSSGGALTVEFRTPASPIVQLNYPIKVKARLSNGQESNVVDLIVR